MDAEVSVPSFLPRNEDGRLAIPLPTPPAELPQPKFFGLGKISPPEPGSLPVPPPPPPPLPPAVDELPRTSFFQKTSPAPSAPSSAPSRPSASAKTVPPSASSGSSAPAKAAGPAAAQTSGAPAPSGPSANGAAPRVPSKPSFKSRGSDYYEAPAESRWQPIDKSAKGDKASTTAAASSSSAAAPAAAEAKQAKAKRTKKGELPREWIDWLNGNWISDKGRQRYTVSLQRGRRGTAKREGGDAAGFLCTLETDERSGVVWWGAKKASYLDLHEFVAQPSLVNWYSSTWPHNVVFTWEKAAPSKVAAAAGAPAVSMGNASSSSTAGPPVTVPVPHFEGKGKGKDVPPPPKNGFSAAPADAAALAAAGKGKGKSAIKGSGKEPFPRMEHVSPLWRVVPPVEEAPAELASGEATTIDAINTLGWRRDWQQALQLLADMQTQRRATPTLPVYNAALAACERSRQWQKALALLRSMPEAGVQPDVTSYNLVMDACGPAFGRPQPAASSAAASSAAISGASLISQPVRLAFQ
eukprot:TRINITY_DN45143_c0_g1_i1.p1 TRINITY_DN45143_c0_g1~~TRINITY_DN45143_c0_g1_i1.p1  ORF type:complete len:526 (+),score=118.26 TRINITY_DN45143_c0_g1_i1:132-1709(+)